MVYQIKKFNFPKQINWVKVYTNLTDLYSILNIKFWQKFPNGPQWNKIWIQN